MRDSDGLTAVQRSLLEQAREAARIAESAGVALGRGDARRNEYNDAHERATRAVTAAEDAGVPPAVLDAATAARPPAVRVAQGRA